VGAQILGCHSPTALAAFSLLDLYVSKLPNGAKEKDAFYFTALPKTPEDPEKQYSTVPIGWNKLDRMVKDMFANAYISGKNNHSLRATGTTQMYNHGLREKTLKIRTGHKSINGLRAYERPGLEQQQEPLLMLLTNKAKRAVDLMLTSVVENSCTNHSPSYFPSCAFCEFCMVPLMSSLGQS